MGNDAAVACFADADGNAHADNYWNVLEYAASPTGFFSLPVAVSNMYRKDTEHLYHAFVYSLITWPITLL